MSDSNGGGRLHRLLSPLLRRATRRYFVGPGLQDALAVHGQLASRAVASTLGYWERVGDAPAATVEVYHRTLDALADAGAESYLSVKAWALGFEPSLVGALAEHGRRRGVRVHYDSLEPGWADAHVRLVEEQAARGVPVGCTVASRWRRSAADAARLARAGCVVRVVKGMCAAPAAEAVEPSQGFEACVARLAEGSTPLRLATHDHLLLRRMLERLQGRPGVEVELLWGLPMGKVLPLAAQFGRPVRAYLPFGNGYLPYSLAALRRSPRIAWWILKDALAPGAAELVSPPGPSATP